MRGHPFHDLEQYEIAFRVLTVLRASIEATTPAGKWVCGICAGLAEFERALISERTQAGLASVRVRGRKGRASFKMPAAKFRLALAAMGSRKPERPFPARNSA